MFYVDLTNEEEAKTMRKEDDAVEKEKSKNGEKSGKINIRYPFKLFLLLLFLYCINVCPVYSLVLFLLFIVSLNLLAVMRSKANG